MSGTAKRRRFARIHQQLSELLAATGDPVAHRATAAALLHHKVPGVSWTGFYLLKDDELVIDAYQGPVACLVLRQHTGVCWAAIDQRSTQLVRDVHAFPGHIACDARSRSELVVPLFGPDNLTVGCLDVDSHHPGHFDEEDQHGYESIVRLLESLQH